MTTPSYYTNYVACTKQQTLHATMKQDTIETRLTAIENKLGELLSQHDELLDLDGFCQLGHIPKSSAYRIIKFCPSFKKGKRIYVKRSDAFNFFTSNKRMSVDEMMSLAADSVVNGSPLNVTRTMSDPLIRTPSNSLLNGQRKENELNNLRPVFDYEKSGIGVEDFITEAELLIKQGNEAGESKGLFLVRTANRWIEQAKARPIPQKLFGEFWFEGELCILFADTNLGKSILAVQMGNSISEGKPIQSFWLEAEKQKILYFDFELSDKQFEARYSINFEQHYTFDSNFLRAEMNPEKSDYKEHGFETFEKFLYDSLERSIIETEAKILIIDNITYLKNETEKAKDALPLMKHLKALKNKYGLSILALAHTPKRDLSKPITRNDLQGSKMLINFCDSSFSIGESGTDKNIRYLKQIKARNTEIIFDTENVCVCQITKPRNFLQFEFLNFGSEQEHLRQQTESEKTELVNSVRNLLEAEPGISAYEIAKRLCPDESKFNSFKVKITRIVNKISKGNIGNSSNK